MTQDVNFDPTKPEQIWDIINPEDDGYLNIEAMRVAAIPFTLAENSYIMVNVIHTARVQDWSLRCWFSITPYGESLVWNNDMISSWAARRYKLYQICLHTGDAVGTDPEVPVYSLKVSPGTYHLNIQNFFNGQNGCYVLLTNS
jgi:hypothetical protein